MIRRLFNFVAALSALGLIGIIVLLCSGWCDWPPRTIWAAGPYSVIVAQDFVTISKGDIRTPGFEWSKQIWLVFVAAALALPPFFWCSIMIAVPGRRGGSGFPVGPPRTR